jgi:GH15 family glucan-1,4-alpha-glucosidase
MGKIIRGVLENDSMRINSDCPDISKERAMRCLRWIESQADEKFLLPEQVDIKEWIYYRIWKRKWEGIPKPLLWSHAMYL